MRSKAVISAAAVLLLLACSGGSESGGTAGSGGSGAAASGGSGAGAGSGAAPSGGSSASAGSGADFFDLDGVRYIEGAPIPSQNSVAFATAYYVLDSSVCAGANPFTRLDFYGDPYYVPLLLIALKGEPPASLPATYPIAFKILCTDPPDTGLAPGEARLDFTPDATPSHDCVAEQGSVTITAYGAVGQPVEGSYSVSKVTTLSAPACSLQSLSGSFRATRTSDLPSQP